MSNSKLLTNMIEKNIEGEILSNIFIQRAKSVVEKIQEKIDLILYV